MKRTKELFQELQEEIANEMILIDNGDANTALPMYQVLRDMEKFAKESKTEVEQSAMIDVENGFELNGFDVKIKTGSTRYVYTHIPAHAEAVKAVKEIEERSKQAFLSFQKNIQVASEDGEEIVFPEVVRSKDSISITKKR